MSRTHLDKTIVLSAFSFLKCLTPILAFILFFPLTARAEELNREIQTLQDNYQKAPADSVVAKRLGRKYLEANKISDAVKVFEALAERQAGDPEAHFLLGEAIFRSARYPEAAIELKRAYTLDPLKAQYAVRAGEALLAAKRYDELAELSSSSLARNPDPASKTALEWLARCAQERNCGGTGNKLPKAKGQS